jgi:hypothetical protein
MDFFRELKTENNPDGNHYLVYVANPDTRGKHYVSEMIDDDSAAAAKANEIGLTLRARLDRSGGKYAMLEGSIFNPTRLLRIVCSVTEYDVKSFTDGIYKSGHNLLTVKADGCVNKYLVYNDRLLRELVDTIEYKMSKN